MNNTIKFLVNGKNSGKRIDIFLTENTNQFTRSFLKKLIKNKQVKLNGHLLLSQSTKIKYKDKIEINFVESQGTTRASRVFL